MRHRRLKRSPLTDLTDLTEPELLDGFQGGELCCCDCGGHRSEEEVEKGVRASEPRKDRHSGEGEREREAKEGKKSESFWLSFLNKIYLIRISDTDEVALSCAVLVGSH